MARTRFTAVARDAAGNTATSAGVSVRVNNPGPSPLPGVIVTSLSYASGVFTSTVKNQGTAVTPGPYDDTLPVDKSH